MSTQQLSRSETEALFNWHLQQIREESSQLPTDCKPLFLTAEEKRFNNMLEVVEKRIELIQLHAKRLREIAETARNEQP